MSTSHAEERLEAILEEVKEAFPFYSEEKQCAIARARFEGELI